MGGQVSIAYKETRAAGQKPGELITDPEHFFNEILMEGYDEYKAIHDQAPAHVKQAIADLFDGMSPYRSKALAASTHEEIVGPDTSDEERRELMRKLNEILKA